MRDAPAPDRSVLFGDFALLLDSGELKKNGVRVRLSGQAFDVLVVLVSARGRIVAREELQAKLWPGSSFGDFEHGLNAAVNRLREALGDSAAVPSYIETAPRRGYRFIAPVIDARAAFGELPIVNPAIPNPTATPVDPSTTRPRIYARFAVPALLILLAVIAASWFVLGRRPPADDLSSLSESPLTTLPGSEISPTFSPDGSQVAFEWDGETGGAGYDLYAQVVGSENPVRLTHRPASTYVSAAWSPDGRFIATRSNDTEKGAIDLIPATGGPARRLLQLDGYFATNLLNWAPDAKSLVIAERVGDNDDPGMGALYTVPIATLERTKLVKDCNIPVVPAYSPAGDSLAFVCIVTFDRTQIRLLHLADRRGETLLDEPADIAGIAWSADGHYLYYSAANLGGISFLWRLEVAHPEHRVRLPMGRDATSITVSPRGDRLAYVRSLPSVNIWRLALPGPDDARTSATHPMPAQATQWISSTREQGLPAISPDGTRIAFDSNRSGSSEVWISDAGGRNLQQLTSFNSKTGTPSWSPDSRHLAFDSRAGGEANVYIWSVDGGAPRKLVTSTRQNSVATWSADGKSLFYDSGPDGGVNAIWRVDAQGGAATEIIADGLEPIASPDGDHLFFFRYKRGLIHVMRARVDGSGIEVIQDLPSPRITAAICPIANVLYILSPVDGADEIDILDLATRKRTPLYRLTRPALEWDGGLAVSTDQRWLLFTEVDELRDDLNLISGLKNQPR